MKIDPRRWLLLWSALLLLCPSLSLAQPAGHRSDAWTFLEAWKTFRYDLDTTLPGEHGNVPLVERMRHEPPWITRSAIRMGTDPATLSFLARRVGRRGGSQDIPALRQALAATPDGANRRVLERALVRLGDQKMLETLARRLREATIPERWEVSATLGAAGQKAVPTLNAALEDPDVQTQMAAASALAARGDRVAKRRLRKLLNSNNPFHRVEAAHALARAGDSKSLDVLREELAQGRGDALRVVRSIGHVGTASEKTLLVGTFGSLKRGRSLALRRELLLALGRIVVRVELAELTAPLAGIDEEFDDDSGVRGAWLAAIGLAAAQGAEGAAGYRAKIRAGLERPFTASGETPVAHKLRQQRVAPLLDALSGSRQAPAELTRVDAPMETLRSWLKIRNSSDATARSRRFDASLVLLAKLGERLGHPALAEPPVARATGLGGDRAVDGNFLTAWIAGDMAGPLRLEFPVAKRVTEVHIVGGCVTSQSAYNDHARVKGLTVTLDGGRKTQGTLRDGDPYFQKIALPQGPPTTRITLEVSSTYPAKRAKRPACISEIRLSH